jgi:hypothetical protein
MRYIAWTAILFGLTAPATAQETATERDPENAQQLLGPIGAEQAVTSDWRSAKHEDESPVENAEAVVDVSEEESGGNILQTKLLGRLIPTAIGGTELAHCDGCKQELTDCCCGQCEWMAFGEYLLLQPRGADAVFALRSTACAGTGLAPLLGSEQLDFDAESGFNVGIAKMLCDGCSSIGANFMHFEANQTGTATAIPPQVLFPTLVFDPLATCNATTSSFARATSSINFDRVAVDYKRNFEWCCIDMDWVAGFAYGQLNQDLKARYDDTRFVSVVSDSWGYGAHFGLGGEYGFGCLRGLAHVDLTLLASNAEAHFRQTEKLGPTNVIADVDHQVDRIIPVLDLRLGAAYDVCDNVTVSAGYVYSIWFNVVTTPDFVHDVQTAHFDSGDGDTLTFDGLFARIEVRW